MVDHAHWLERIFLLKFSALDHSMILDADVTRELKWLHFFLWWVAEVTKGYGKQVPSMTVCQWIPLVQATSCHTCNWQSQLLRPSFVCFSGKFYLTIKIAQDAPSWHGFLCFGHCDAIFVGVCCPMKQYHKAKSSDVSESTEQPSDTVWTNAESI